MFSFLKDAVSKDEQYYEDDVKILSYYETFMRKLVCHLELIAYM